MQAISAPKNAPAATSSALTSSLVQSRTASAPVSTRCALLPVDSFWCQASEKSSSRSKPQTLARMRASIDMRPITRLVDSRTIATHACPTPSVAMSRYMGVSESPRCQPIRKSATRPIR